MMDLVVFNDEEEYFDGQRPCSSQDQHDFPGMPAHHAFSRSFYRAWVDQEIDLVQFFTLWGPVILRESIGADECLRFRCI